MVGCRDFAGAEQLGSEMDGRAVRTAAILTGAALIDIALLWGLLAVFGPAYLTLILWIALAILVVVLARDLDQRLAGRR